MTDPDEARMLEALLRRASTGVDGEPGMTEHDEERLYEWMIANRDD